MKKSLKKMLLLVAAVLTVASLSLPAQAATIRVIDDVAPAAQPQGSYSDVAGHWAQQWIEEATRLGLMVGVGDGRFDPQGPVMQAQACVIAVRLADQLGWDPAPNTSIWGSLPQDSWYGVSCSRVINRFARYGCESWQETDYSKAGQLLFVDADGKKHVSGPTTNTYYRFWPDQNATRIYVAAVVGGWTAATDWSYSPPFPDTGSYSKFEQDALENLFLHGVVSGYPNGYFGPADSITRAEMAVIAVNDRNRLAGVSRPANGY